MRIVIDVSQAQYEHSGVGRYTNELIPELINQGSEHLFVLLYVGMHKPFSSLKLASAVSKAGNVLVKSIRIPEKLAHLIWNDLHIVRLESLVGKHDVFFASDWFTPLTHAKVYTTVHDLVFRIYPKTVHPYILNTQKKRLSFYTLQKQVFYFVDSKATMKDLINFYSVRKNKIKVVYPGVKVFLQSLSLAHDVIDSYGLSKEKYIVAVGKKEPRKNFERLIKAMDIVVKKNPDIKLVIVGSDGWGNVSFKKRDYIVFANNINDMELASFYKMAACCVTPSLYEGFGFSVVEAMAAGCPTATAYTSSLIEVGGSATVFFNPYKINEMAQALLNIIQNPKKRSELRAKGKKQAAKFSWQKTAQAVLSIMEENL